MIDKCGYKPYYIQIKEILQKRIYDGIYKPGDMLPSENTLASEFGVTRITVRNAIRELKNEGLVLTEKGKGIFVTHPRIEQSLLQFYSFGRNYGKNNNNASTRLISFNEIDTNLNLKEKLNLKTERAFEIIRVRYVNEIPLILETSFIPIEYSKGIDKYNLERESLYDILEKINNVKIINAKETIEPSLSNEYSSKLLNVSLNHPVFYVERITYIKDQKPIEFRISIIRGDKFKFSVELK